MSFNKASTCFLGVIFVTCLPLIAHTQETNQSVGNSNRCNSLMGRGNNNNVNLDCSETIIINNFHYPHYQGEASAKTLSNSQDVISVSDQGGLLRIREPSPRTTSVLKDQTTLSIKQPERKTTSIIEGQTTLRVD